MVSPNTLPAQPPTPPGDIDQAIDEAIDFLDTSYDLSESTDIKAYSTLVSERHGFLNTPPTSSPSKEPRVSSELSERPAKRLRFSERPVNVPTQCMPESLKPVAPSRSLKSIRSILKSSNSVLPSSLDFPDLPPLPSPQPFTSMLESICKQLAGEDRASRHSAYMTLSNSLRAYDDLPDTEALFRKLPLFEGFLKRDVESEPSNTIPTHRVLSLPALKLTYMFLVKFTPTQNFSNDFLGFIINRVLRILATPGTSKEISLHHIQLLTTKKLYTRVLSVDRICKLLGALKDVENRISGNNIINVRLIIYERLVRHAPVQIIEQFEDVMSRILNCLTSSHKETRIQAMQTALAAATTFGHSKRVSLAMKSLLFRQAESEKPSRLSLLETRLHRMLEDEEACYHVPQVWSIIILLLRGNQQVLETCLRRMNWLGHMEKCFHSKVTRLNLQTWSAWNRVIYAVNLNPSTRQSITRMLCKPIIGQLQRRSCDPQSVQVKDAAISSLCTLIYYGLRPTADHAQLDLYWNTVIRGTLHIVPNYSCADSRRLCRLISTLLHQPSIVPWNANRVLEKRPSLQWCEIPRIDPLWVRKNVRQILSVIKPLLSACSSSNRDDVSSDEDLWESLMKSIFDAGKKEIHASVDLKIAIAEIVNFLIMLSQQHFQDDHPRESWITTHKIVSYSAQAMNILGPLPFTDTLLHRSEAGSYEVINTSSRYLREQSDNLITPISALISDLTLSQLKTGKPMPDNVKSLLMPCWETRSTVDEKHMFLSNCVDALPCQSSEVEVDLWTHCLWQEIAGLGLTCLKNSDCVQVSPSKTNALCKTIIKIIGYGLNTLCDGSCSLMQSLYSSLYECCKINADDAAAGLVVLEPVLRLISGYRTGVNSYNLQFRLCSTIIESLNVTTAQDAFLTAANTFNFGKETTETSVATWWCCTIIPFLNTQLILSYEKLLEVEAPIVQNLLRSLSSFLEQVVYLDDTFGNLKSELIAALQYGITGFISDEDRNATKMSNQSPALRHSKIRSVWTVVLQLILLEYARGKLTLKDVEPLLCAGFRSRDRELVSLSVLSWNTHLGGTESIDYPESLVAVLSTLRNYVEITLPCFPRCTPSNKNDSKQDVLLWLDDESSSQSFGVRSSQSLLNYNTEKLDLDSSLVPLENVWERCQATTALPQFGYEDSHIGQSAVFSAESEVVQAESQHLTIQPQENRTHQPKETSFSSDPLTSSSYIENGRSPLDELTNLCDHQVSSDGYFSIDEASPLASKVSRISASPKALFLDISLDYNHEDVPSSPPEVVEEPVIDINVLGDEKDLYGTNREENSSLRLCADSQETKADSSQDILYPSSMGEMPKVAATQTIHNAAQDTIMCDSETNDESLHEEISISRIEDSFPHAPGKRLGKTNSTPRRASLRSSSRLSTLAQASSQSLANDHNNSRKRKRQSDMPRQFSDQEKENEHSLEDESVPDDEDVIVVSTWNADCPSLSEVVASISDPAYPVSRQRTISAEPARLKRRRSSSTSPVIQPDSEENCPKSISSTTCPGASESIVSRRKSSRLAGEEPVEVIPAGRMKRKRSEMECEIPAGAQTDATEEVLLSSRRLLRGTSRCRINSSQSTISPKPVLEDETRFCEPQGAGEGVEEENEVLVACSVTADEPQQQQEEANQDIGAEEKQDRSSSGQPQSQSKRFAQFVIRKLSGVVEDCKSLFLGTDSFRLERDQLQDLTSSLHEEILAAENRGSISGSRKRRRISYSHRSS